MTQHQIAIRSMERYSVRVSLDEKPWNEELLIAYRPFHSTEKWLEYRFSEWNTWKAWAALVMVCAFFMLQGPDHILQWLRMVTEGGATVVPPPSALVPAVPVDPFAAATGAGIVETASTGGAAGGAIAFSSAKVVEWFAIFACVVTGGTIASISRKPTHLMLNDRGIAWEWRRSLMNYGKRVPWAAVTHIGVSWPQDRTSVQDCLITISTADKKDAMQIKLGGIATTEQREHLLKCIEMWAPDVSKDAELFDVLTPPPDHSYTELWLQALSAPPKREKLTPLIGGAVLYDGAYQIVEQLGVGGQGTAYLSWTKDRSEVVLKEFILPVYVDINVRRQALERMQNEVEMLKRLDNDRIVKLKDFFIEDHRGYLVLELIDGDSLRTIVGREGKLSEERVVSLMHQMCDILEYLHSLTPPVVHRDFTPDNMILGNDGILKLVDFNVAQQKDVTATGTVVGKHAYIPPEQFRGKPNSQSDIYAMLASVFYLLVGEDPEPITSSHPQEALPTVSNALDHIVAKGTALDIAYRYKDAAEIRHDLLMLTNTPKIASDQT